MQFSDEVLMAYADGELDAQTSRAIEDAMGSDATLAERIARHRGLRSQLTDAYAGVLEEPVPDRLLEAANSSPASADRSTGNLAAARSAKARIAPRPRRWSWPEWTAMAASVLIGLFAGRAVLHSPDSQLLAMSGDGPLARGALAQALSEQIGQPPPAGSNIDIGLSFRSRSGEYCRTFHAAADAIAGLACRAADEWQVRTLTRSAASRSQAAPPTQYRMAATALPPAILAAVQETIEGDALDAKQEAQARERGWRP